MRGKSHLTGRRSRVDRIAVAGLVAALAITAGAASPAPAASERSHATAHPSRVDLLVSRMTLDEKLQMLSGGPESAATNEYEAGYLPGIPRLGIPSLRFTDGPPGVATRRLSTGMTQTMGVAATFSREDAWLNGRVIGRDARALGQDVMLEPFINLDRDPAAGRTWNTFGEDPVLSGALGAETIAGIQSQGVMAQAKHYIGFDGPNGNVVVDQQTLHEVYLKPFQDAVDAGVSSVMCAYNRINGDGSCDSPTMLDTVLKGQLGFKGFVTSDWGATHATDDISSGLDLEMPGANTYGGVIPAYMTPAQLKAAIAAGTVQDTRIDDAVRRILGQYERFGFLDGAPKHTVTDEAIEPNARVVLRTGEDAATLLKNDDRALPLNAPDLASLAMIGPGAGQTMATGGGGEKATGRAERWIGTVDALKRTTSGRAHHLRRRRRHERHPDPRERPVTRWRAGPRRDDGRKPRHAGRRPDRVQPRARHGASGRLGAFVDRDPHRARERHLLDQLRRARHHRLGRHRRHDGHPLRRLRRFRGTTPGHRQGR